MKAIFNTHGNDSELNCRSGQKVEIIRPLTETECDIAEVGNMYKVRFDDGTEIDVFEDELLNIRTEHYRQMGLNNRKHFGCTYCGKDKHYARGFCESCYNKWRRGTLYKNEI